MLFREVSYPFTLDLGDKSIPRLLDHAAAEDLSFARIEEAMSAVGHTRNALHQPDR